MEKRRPRSDDYAIRALHRDRQSARKWGLIVLLAGLAVGALAAPNTTLLVFVALVVFGGFGLGVQWATRAFGRWFDGPRG